MKIDEHLLKFPKYLPNDLEGLMFYYPEKFPLIVSDFEEVAPKIAGDPEAFRQYSDHVRDELWAAYEKIKKDYEKGDQTNLEFLVGVDERFSKIYCYRFWIINYLFPDGPIHDFLVDNLKNLIRKFIDVTEDIEDFEQRVVRIQRDLLQSDYADLYLQQALDGVKAVELLKANKKIAEKLPTVTQLIDEHSHSNTEKINSVWQEVYKIIKSDEDAVALREAMAVPLSQVEMRSSILPLYNMLTHAIEFREENEQLTKRHGGMLGTIDKYKDLARKELTAEEYELFEFCYEQARNFSMYKDVMGAIDEVLLPLWFGLHRQIKKLLIDNGVKIRERPTGPTAVSAHFVWYLPDELKAKVMTPDLVPFSLETI
ncbi:MAG: hypothetical protein UW74_C0029G0002 [Candidatus Giovannonibacteria bacterium GW2011_GWC2_44_8]|uniref:Uncharacterized protein n=2 Tax=Patescibacteria group TaxID=1783273 RepID=A0A0G0X3H0_9BACT|nr:MAG: hypothetical protein UU41_C0044G0002 [Candidatus Roizmanbacteria bacterium GW2011_GWA1_41_13]KKT78010.1 MAG: hypothetical protein UW74_C0029G0002 [Candidatus Giovannonibacteria bacterium GW2011_GWC2_44_8]